MMYIIHLHNTMLHLHNVCGCCGCGCGWNRAAT